MSQLKKPKKTKAAWIKWSVRLGLALVFLSVFAVLGLRFINPPSSAFMLAHSWASTNGAVSYTWVDKSKIAPEMFLSVIASEDQLFATHQGFDVESIQKAWSDSQTGKRNRGASTISQQVAKNLFLWSGRSWLRKGLEVWFTGLIEAMWSKQRILEVYLNIAEFGIGIYGVEAAAQHYFQKPASQLSLRQAALLAAVLPSPKSMNPAKPGSYTLQRARWIERQVAQLGGREMLEQIR